MNETAQKSTRDYHFLLHQVKHLPFNAESGDKITAILSDMEFRQSLSAQEYLCCITAAQLHGAIETALSLLEQLNIQHPKAIGGWLEHRNILHVLGENNKLMQLRARAGKVLTQQDMKTIFSADENTLSTEQNHPTEWITAPFTELHREEDQLLFYRDIFSGRDDIFARQWKDSKTGEQGYVPVRRPMQLDDIRDHLKGHKTYGIYLMQPDNRVNVGVIDIDIVSSFRGRKLTGTERDQLRREGIFLLGRIKELAAQYKMEGIAEFSGGKGYHFWYPVRESVEAKWMRRGLQNIVDQIKNDVSCFNFEVFPKQDKVSGKGMGNLVKLPLGIHRKTGKPSYFLDCADRSTEPQLEFLKQTPLIDPATLRKNGSPKTGVIIAHPRQESWAKKYPELAELEAKCTMIAQITASLRQSKSLNIREEKILLGTLSHLPRSRVLLHHLFSALPEYNRPLLDYQISRVRGTPLGCKRIHSLLEDGDASLPCEFDKISGYPHPLLHVQNFTTPLPKSEKIEDFQQALANLKTAVIEFERFLPHCE